MDDSKNTLNTIKDNSAKPTVESFDEISNSERRNNLGI